ncbi:MAG: hypothetical protein EA374_02480, partial [Acholeplasmatales bacterium]
APPGLNFLGWFHDEDVTVPFTLETMPAYDVTVVAGYHPVEPDEPVFVRVEGDQLFLGDDVFRFVSFNIPNLHVLEDPYWHRVDPFEQRDALQSIRDMGGRVARIYTFSIVGGIRPSEAGNTLAHIMGVETYYEPLFEDLDMALKIANEMDVKLIIPFIDEWDWFGGIAAFAALYGKPRSAFFTDPEIKAGFKHLIEFVLLRENTLTGVLYKDDPAILAWQLGNELRSAPDAWIDEMAHYVKSLDDNHLLLSGRDKVNTFDLNHPLIDIMNVHYYRNNTQGTFSANAAADRAATKDIKPLLIGEYGLVNFEEIEAMVLETVENGTAGSLIWSLRFRNVEGGFYFHDDFGELNTRSYHYPGFPRNDDYYEQAIIALMTAQAHAVQGKTVGLPPLPEAPVLFPLDAMNGLTFRGATGSYAFQIERRIDGTTDWEVLADSVYDIFEAGPFYIDTTGQDGVVYAYRIKAYNAAGFSPYSNTVLHTYTHTTLPVNVALGRPVSASSEEDDRGTIHQAAYVTDGNFQTRWSSDYSDEAWLEIDLESVQTVRRLVLHWETAHAANFIVEVSVDGDVYETLVIEHEGAGGVATYTFTEQSVRFIRFEFLTRATQWGYSLYQIEVFDA